jgi:hypothetical protein
MDQGMYLTGMQEKARDESPVVGGSGPLHEFKNERPHHYAKIFRISRLTLRIQRMASVRKRIQKGARG